MLIKKWPKRFAFWSAVSLTGLQVLMFHFKTIKWCNASDFKSKPLAGGPYNASTYVFRVKMVEDQKGDINCKYENVQLQAFCISHMYRGNSREFILKTTNSY